MRAMRVTMKAKANSPRTEGAKGDDVAALLSRVVTLLEEIKDSMPFKGVKL